MNDFNVGEPRKTSDIECHDLRNIVGFHRSDKPRIVHLNTPNGMS